MNAADVPSPAPGFGDRRLAPVLDRAHRRLAEIEYLRAAAMLLVIIMHAPLICVPYPPGALQRLQDWIHPAVGVDLFFVISGYLMGRFFMAPFEAHEPGNPVPSILAFWVRRFYRLLPACAVWVGFTLACCVVFAGSPLWIPPHSMYFKALASLLSVRNFEESFAQTRFGYVWSLSVENQFYLALPLFLVIVRRRWRIPGMVALCALNAVWRPGGEAWWLFRYDGLIYGLLLFELERAGYAEIAGRCLPQSRGGRVAFAATAGIAMLTAPLVLIYLHPLAWTVVNFAAFALVFAASRGQGAIPLPRMLSTMFLWLGVRSYSLYLCHIPVWTLVVELMQRSGLGGQGWLAVRFLFAISASLILADLTYLRVELPLQARGRVRAQAIRAGD